MSCSDSAPVAPRRSASALPSSSLSAEGDVTVQAASKAVIITNVLNNLSIEQSVNNAKEATKLCAAVQRINSLLLNGDQLSCTLQSPL